MSTRRGKKKESEGSRTHTHLDNLSECSPSSSVVGGTSARAVPRPKLVTMVSMTELKYEMESLTVVFTEEQQSTRANPLPIPTKRSVRVIVEHEMNVTYH